MTVRTYKVFQGGREVARCARKTEALAEAERLDREVAERTGNPPAQDEAATIRDIARGEWVQR